MAKTSIEWTEITWNPVTGCTKVSEGCRYCYAETMSRRLQAMKLEKYKQGFGKIITHPSTLADPYEWKVPKMVFVNSMSDLFHTDVPDSFICEVFKTMNDNPEHTFQVLTKRIDRAIKFNNKVNWTPNIWLGTSIENSQVIHRAEILKLSDAKIKFLSCEPLLGSIKGIDLNGLDWIIVGGESGKKARPMKEEWVLEIRDLCLVNGISFFFKQWGGTNKKRAGRVLDGLLHNEIPAQ